MYNFYYISCYTGSSPEQSPGGRKTVVVVVVTLEVITLEVNYPSLVY